MLNNSTCLFPLGDCLNGKCNNVKGSYWCACPVGKTGRNCQLSASVCNGNPCGDNHFCIPLPNGPGGNRTCIHKGHKFEMTYELDDDTAWQDHMKYIVEEDLNEIVQNWKPIVSVFTIFVGLAYFVDSVVLSFDSFFA